MSPGVTLSSIPRRHFKQKKNPSGTSRERFKNFRGSFEASRAKSLSWKLPSPTGLTRSKQEQL
jgi:hypothetical protein